LFNILAYEAASQQTERSTSQAQPVLLHPLCHFSTGHTRV